MSEHTTQPSFEGDPPAAAEPDALPDRKELALVAVERTRMPMVVSDARKPDNPIVLANQAFLDLTGYSADEVIGRNCRFLQGELTAEGEVEAIRRGLSAGDHHIDVELLNYRKDGSAFWNQLAISPVHSAEGELLYYFASQKDISTRRRAQELETTERLLLKEVDHRAMNALALVQSIVRLSRADRIGSYAAAVQGRVDALARAHRLLAAANWSGADLRDMVAMEVPTSAAKRVAMSGAPTALPAKLVQPMTLVLHELVSNAAQHGALAVAKGAIAINWKVDAARVTLLWREVDGAVPTADPVPGFGFAIIQGIVERQLGGSFQRSWRPDGLKAELEIPLG